MSEKPIALACTRPRSTRRSLTHRSRRRSVVRAVAGVPAGPILERASRRKRFRISGRLDSSSTGPRRFVRTSASWRQLRPGSSRAAQVGLRGQIGRVVEFHGRRRMDDDVACSQLLAAFIVETKPVATKIDLDHAKLCGRELGETLLTELFLQAFESR